MMQIHCIKLHRNFADAVHNGLKTFEIRKNDRGYQAGDGFFFTVVDDDGHSVEHPVAQVAYRITYLLHGYGLQDGYCVFGIEPQL